MTKGKGKGTFLVQNEEKRREYQKREQLRDVLKKKQDAAAAQKANLEMEKVVQQILIEETKMKKSSESFGTSNDDTADDDWGDFDFTDEEYKEAEAAQSRDGESSGRTNEVAVGEGSLSLKEVEAAKARGETSQSQGLRNSDPTSDGESSGSSTNEVAVGEGSSNNEGDLTEEEEATLGEDELNQAAHGLRNFDLIDGDEGIPITEVALDMVHVQPVYLMSNFATYFTTITVVTTNAGLEYYGFFVGWLDNWARLLIQSHDPAVTFVITTSEISRLYFHYIPH